MNGVDLIGFTAIGLNVWGNLKLAKYSYSGWIIRMVTNVVYITYAVGIEHGLPIVANHVIFFGLNFYGLREWTKKT